MVQRAQPMEKIQFLLHRIKIGFLGIRMNLTPTLRFQLKTSQRRPGFANHQKILMIGDQNAQQVSMKQQLLKPQRRKSLHKIT